MGLMTPSLPDFDVDDWRRQPHGERVRMMSAAWVDQGFGAPVVAYLFYVVKLLIYVGGFLAFAATTPGLGGLGDIGDWWSSPLVFQKAVLWTLLFESLGLGCGSGPLTGRYLPPVTAAAAWLRPGTIRLAPWPWLPLTRGSRRTVIDVALYAAFVVLTVRALLSGAGLGLLDRGTVLPVIVVFVVLGLRDKTVFLSGRSEHYLVAAVVFLFPADLIPGEKAVMLAIWWWAATSKLNLHFPGVIGAMLTNNPLVRSVRLRRALYRHHPDDLRPSRLAAGIAHGATVVEYSFPLMLAVGGGGPLTVVGLVVMVTFHTLILTSFPLGVPLEWNVFFIYSGLVLFGAWAEVPVWTISSPVLIIVLTIVLVVVPLVGNLRPDKVSFLPSMRYYAGNWATSLWCLRPGMFERIDDELVTVAPSPRRQVERLYGPGLFEVVLGRTQAFRSMHLHGRALTTVLAEAVDNPDDYEVVDGELVAGLALGWNFGDGHLHDERLLDAVQSRCGFAPGEVRCVLLESQPFAADWMRWRVVDAALGTVATGRIRVSALADAQPWEATPAALQRSSDDDSAGRGNTGG
jgi:hypothetical protein